MTQEIRSALKYTDLTDPTDVHNLNQQLREISDALADATTNVAAGSVTMYAGTTAPTGWLLCNGQAVSRTTYADLFAVVSTTYGAGDGSSTFNVPNLLGRIPVGLDTGDANFDVLGETGGASTHTLSTAEMPAHSHGVTDPGHTHTELTETHNTLAGGGGFSVAQAATGATTGSSTTGITINSAGGGGVHNNLQPYIALNYIIKT